MCVERTAPTLGRGNRYVLVTIFDYSPERIAELEAQGVLQ
jgi:hypothetical protein